MIKLVQRRVDYDSPTVPLAKFELEGEQVHATYFDANFQRFIEDGTIFVKKKELRPSDGRVFFDSLEQGLASSSRVFVTLLDG